MQFGIIEYQSQKIRAKPSFSGQRAVCPFCGGNIIGKCGEILAWHWQHHSDRDCDPWKEHETDWHRQWKGQFPDDWQEVAIENLGERHRADVKTAAGLVIEFQNSSISTSTIRVREEFYGNMIWVINAQSFKDNFQITSVVRSRLRDAENGTRENISFIKREYNDEVKKVNESIKKNEDTLSDKLRNIEWKRERIERLQTTLKEFDQFAAKALSCWISGGFFWDAEASGIISNAEAEFKNILNTSQKELTKITIEIRSKEDYLKEILHYENFSHDGLNFKIVPYEKIGSKNYQRTRAITKASRMTFFPVITKFNTETEFQSYQFKKDKFDFIVDPTDAKIVLNETIESMRQLALSFENALSSLKFEAVNKMRGAFENKIQSLNEEIGVIQSEIEVLNGQKISLSEKLIKVSTVLAQEVQDNLVAIEAKQQEQRFKIMREKKGLYTFNWSHERKSWRASKKVIYFDTGKEYLFVKTGENSFQKVQITDFLNAHLPV